MTNSNENPSQLQWSFEWELFHLPDMNSYANSDRNPISKNIRHAHTKNDRHKHGTERDRSKNHIEFNDQRHCGSMFTRETSTNRQSFIGDNFVSDRKGDPGILQYGSNHSYQVPPYRRIGYGLVLGLSRSLKIDRESSTDREIRLISSAPDGSKRNKAIFAKVDRSEEHTILPSRTNPEIELNKNYLTLENDDLHDSRASDEDSEDSESLDYRSAVKKTRGPGVSNNSSGSQGVIFQVDPPNDSSSEIKWRRKVELDPSDAQAWLELINQQNSRFSGRQTRAERSSLAEIKLSMYEKALKHVTRPIREDLQRGSLKEASFIWDDAKLQRRWEEILQSNPHSVGLWKDYLDYRQTKNIRFRFDDLRTMFKESFASLRAVEDERSTKNVNGDSKNRSEGGLHALYLLLRYTICLKQAGYIEQAIAIWQVTLESQFCSTAYAKSEEAIEKFWESEVSRMGELNARGFANYSENSGDVPSEQEDSPKPAGKSMSVKTWLDYEKDVLKLLPARTLDITDEEDVFRVVLFPDIQPFVLQGFNMSNESVIDAFLIFNELPPLWQDETASWATDPFIYAGNLEVERMDQSVQANAASSNRYPSLSSRISTDTLFADLKSPLHCFKNIIKRPDTVDSSTSNLEFVGAVLKYLIDSKENADNLKLIEYYLAFQLQYHPKDVRKISKSYLKRYPQALSLYNAYGLVEYRLGNGESAKKVLETAMKMRSEDPEVIMLRRTLVWESLEGDQPALTLEYLLEGTKIHDEATIFATQQRLLLEMDRTAISNQHLVLSYMDCLVILGYLTNPDPLSAALAIFQSNLSFISRKLAKHTDILELSHQSLARLLCYHMQHHQYKPSTIRKAIQHSIIAFPANTIFLSIFQMNEQRFRINDRVRSVVHDILSERDSAVTTKSSLVIAHVFAIHVEMSRLAGLGSSAESIRSVFERAVEEDATRNCPAIWRWYAEFELSQWSKTKSSQRAQNIIFRAMTACPWIRDFCLMAIQFLEEAQRTTEVNGVYEMMIDRELRVRMPLNI